MGAGAHPPIRSAGPADAATLDAGLAALSAELGDVHRTDAAALRAAFAAPVAPFRAVLAGDRGLALYSPVFSTVAGGAGAHVSDLWVAPAARGTGLGPRLLAAAARDAGAAWGAVFLSLVVYDASSAARAVYDRLGFREGTGERRLTLRGEPFDALKGRT